jgi:hypothetical protein
MQFGGTAGAERPYRSIRSTQSFQSISSRSAAKISDIQCCRSEPGSGKGLGESRIPGRQGTCISEQHPYIYPIRLNRAQVDCAARCLSFAESGGNPPDYNGSNPLIGSAPPPGIKLLAAPSQVPECLGGNRNLGRSGVLRLGAASQNGRFWLKFR